MIHTVEGSLHPEDGLKSAELLADLMPDVAHVVHMPSHIYIRSGNYRKGIDVNDRAVTGYNKYVQLYQPVTEGAGLYLLHAVHMKIACAMGRLTEAGRELELLEKGLRDTALKASYDPFSNAYDAGLVAKGVLAGVLAEKKKDYKLAREAFQGAVAAEDALIYDEPRDWAIPARQYLGDLLLRMGAFGEAVKVFQRDLEINPMNGWSLTGLQLGYKAMGDNVALGG